MPCDPGCQGSEKSSITATWLPGIRLFTEGEAVSPRQNPWFIYPLPREQWEGGLPHTGR